MKVLERYYGKIYRHTEKLLKKVFGKNVIESMKRSCELRKEIESKIGKPIIEITLDDLVSKKVSCQYCEYRTLEEILGIISGASFLKAYRKEELKEIENENK